MIFYTKDYTNAQLLKIFRRKDKSPKNYWLYDQLNQEDKARLFNLLVSQNIKPKIDVRR
ncbi:MAG: hypothetical protein Q7R52_03555 [archaeon]|nr:hypothetical protein [archaeon]